ncbi:hypothetical protein CBW16_10060 [Flavobacteriaceae bacterium JJC]|nr:hypothetical protein CBW16_10060 [Flavobacteriaceae bacterium JJC]
MKLLKILFIFLAIPLLGQQKTLAKFTITESTENGKDNTAFDIERGGYFVIYQKDSELYLANVANVWKQQSFGRILNLEVETLEETENEFQADVFNFRWKYFNDYDERTGYATIRLSKIYKPQGVLFTLKMVLPNLDVLTYKGYMEGSLDFSDFIK